MSKSLTCPNCGGTVIDSGGEYGVCDSCGSQIHIRDRFVQEAPVYSSNNSNAQGERKSSVRKLPVTSYGSTVTGEKSMAVGMILSIIIVGTGLMYAGAVGKGILYLILSVVLGITIIVPLIFWILGIVKTYKFIEENNILWKEYNNEI